MIADDELDLPTVTRVGTPEGTRVEPPLDPAWTEAKKLAWHAAVCAADTQLSVRVFRDPNGFYSVTVAGRGGRGSSTLGGLSYRSAWDWLNGITIGVEITRLDLGQLA